MADLTLTVAVTTGTQYVTGSTGSIYTFDGSQPASFTFPWVASGTVRLEQSGSSNDGHPLIFSTSNSETLGTMRAGIISSGVTYYLDGSSTESDYTNTTTFNAATTRYIEIAPASETDFYFACWVHGIGMGGIMDLSLDTWGANAWNYNSWGEQDEVTVSLTGLSATTALGTVVAFPEQGWGSDYWGIENWGESGLIVSLTGLSATTTLGTVTASFYPGWGTLTWGENGWGTITEGTIPLTGVSATTSVGAITPADQVMGLTGQSATTTLGTPVVTPETIASVTGVSATTADGSLNIIIGVPLTGVSATTSLGTVTAVANVTASLTGVSADTDVGSLTITSNPTVQPTGLSATTSVGAITPADQVMGLTGVSATTSVGAITPKDQVMGLTGQSATITLGTVSPIHYKADTITGYTAYTVETLAS